MIRKVVKALVVEDENIWAEAICNTMQAMGFKTNTTSDPSVAVELLERPEYKVLTLDLDLRTGRNIPPVLGWDLLRICNIRKDIQVIIITGALNREESRLAHGNDLFESFEDVINRYKENIILLRHKKNLLNEIDDGLPTLRKDLEAKNLREKTGLASRRRTRIKLPSINVGGPIQYNWASKKIMFKDCAMDSDQLPERLSSVLDKMTDRDAASKGKISASATYLEIAVAYEIGKFREKNRGQGITQRILLEQTKKIKERIENEGSAIMVAQAFRQDLVRFLKKTGLSNEGGAILKARSKQGIYRLGSIWDHTRPVLYRSEVGLTFVGDLGTRAESSED